MVIGVLAVIGLAAILLKLIGRPSFFIDEVVQRAASPDGVVVAAVIQTNGGATVATSRVVVSLAKGEQAKDILSEGVVVLQYRDQAFLDPKLRWLGPNRLRIELPCAAFDHAANTADFFKDQQFRRVAIEWHNVDPHCMLERAS